MWIVIFNIVVMGLVKHTVRVVVAIWVFVSDSSGLTHARVWIDPIKTCHTILHGFLGLILTRDQKYTFMETTYHRYLGWLLSSLAWSRLLRFVIRVWSWLRRGIIDSGGWCHCFNCWGHALCLAWGWHTTLILRWRHFLHILVLHILNIDILDWATVISVRTSNKVLSSVVWTGSLFEKHLAGWSVLLWLLVVGGNHLLLLMDWVDSCHTRI